MAEEEAFAELTRYLLRTYARSGKTFILQNWEGDWALRGSFDPKAAPTPTAIDTMIRWLAARQRGVARARTEEAAEGVQVFHAAEVNLVKQAMEGGIPTVTTDVLPHVPLDLVSYSAWDTTHDEELFRKALDFIARHKQPTKPFGEKGVYVGEFGLPETEHSTEKALHRVSTVMKVAKSWGAPYAVYWQLYCNEPLKPEPKANADFKGFWLIRPDGTRSPVCSILFGE